MSERKGRIRALNDELRRTFRGGVVLQTRGVEELGPGLVARVHEQVRTFSGFTRANDPHEEHDFGSFVLDGRKLYWKIDYYDERMEFGSEDPADPERTTRVLTICLAEEC
jgi:hypothetical protein